MVRKIFLFPKKKENSRMPLDITVVFVRSALRARPACVECVMSRIASHENYCLGVSVQYIEVVKRTRFHLHP